MALITTATTISLINIFKDPILKALGNASVEIKYLFDDGLPTYINSIGVKILKHFYIEMKQSIFMTFSFQFR